MKRQPRRYIEPDPTDPKYKDCRTKECTGPCNRVLPVHPDFFNIHSVNMNGTTYQYRAGRPDCRSCRSEKARRDRIQKVKQEGRG